MAKVKGTLETEFKKIERCQLLILDDLFLVPLDAKECPILLEIIEDRHEWEINHHNLAISILITYSLTIKGLKMFVC